MRQMIGVLFALASGLSCNSRAAVPDDRAEPTGAVAAVTTHTYLKASLGNRELLAQFVEANWFAMDSLAVGKGLFRSFRLLENSDKAGEWDWIVEVVYNDACGYQCIAGPFERIRAAHQTVLINGKAMPELGTVMKSVSFLPRQSPGA